MGPRAGNLSPGGSEETSRKTESLSPAWGQERETKRLGVFHLLEGRIEERG